MVTLLTRMQARDAAAAEEVVGMLADLARHAPAEPGYISYRAFSAEQDPLVHYIVEEWSSGADAQRHADIVAGSGVLERSAALLVGDVDTQTLVPQ